MPLLKPLSVADVVQKMPNDLVLRSMRDGAEHDPLVSKHAIYNHRSCRQGRAPAQCGTRMCAPRP